MVKNLPANSGDLGLIPGLGRYSGEGHGNPLQYSCLENPKDQRRLAGYSPQCHKESDTTEVTYHSSTGTYIGYLIITCQFSPVAQSCLTLCNPMDCSTPGFPVHYKSWSLLKLMSIESVIPSNHLILCRPLHLSSIFPNIRVFSSESVLCIRQPKYWSFSFNISPSNEYLGLISFRMDWLDLLAVQGTLKNLLQHHS